MLSGLVDSCSFRSWTCGSTKCPVAPELAIPSFVPRVMLMHSVSVVALLQLLSDSDAVEAVALSVFDDVHLLAMTVMSLSSGYV